MSKQARTKAREARIAREAAERRTRRRNRLLAGGGVVIVGLLVAIVISLVNAAGNASDDAASQKPLVTPTGVTDNGAISLGKAEAPVKLEVYLDYMCPYCGRFELANGEEISRLVAEGTVRLELHPLAFLDRMSDGTRYSTRTANAVVTVADKAPDKALAFSNALFARQPAEGSKGLTNDEIAELAGGAGVPQDVIAQFSAETFQPWVAKYTELAFDSGITGTPTVKINGEVYKGDLYTAGPLTQAILTAKG